MNVAVKDNSIFTIISIISIIGIGDSVGLRCIDV